MDKWERRDIGYRTDWPDGDYYVTHIIFGAKGDPENHKREITIKNGLVQVIGDKYLFSQDHFFEVNKVLRKID